MKLILSEALGAQIQSEALAARPGECCGLIEGVFSGELFEARALHPARNRATAPDRFEIDAQDHIAAAKSARGRGHRLIGCYHSHPDGQFQPSFHDRGGEENFLWLIAATDGASAKLAAWLYREGGFSPLDLRIGPGADLVTSSLKVRS